jgi:murein DD-endopeptidase MepM/ murein hydrolase activator NlpD
VLPVTIKSFEWPATQERVKLAFGEQVIFAFKDPNTTGQWGALIGVDALAKTGSVPLRVFDAKGIQKAATSLTVTETNYRKQYITVSKTTAGLEPQAGEMEAIQAFKNAVTPTRYWSDALALQKPVPQCMNSPFGVKRVYNGVFSGNYHKGIDQKSPQGHPIVSAEAGVVKIAQTYRLHGGTVAVDHGQGLGTIYIHMSRIDVKPGQVVRKGEQLGKVGATGFAAGPHLHWGAYVQGNPVDPKALTPGISGC